MRKIIKKINRRNFKKILHELNPKNYVNPFHCIKVRKYLREGKKFNILSARETVDLIIQKRLNIARYGDGEVGLMRGNKVGFQDCSEELKNKLLYVATQPNDKTMVCLASPIVDYSDLRRRAQRFFKRYLRRNFYYIYKFFDYTKVYGDASITRFYIDYQDKSGAMERFNNLKRIWDKRNLLIVEGEQSRMGVGNDIYDNALNIRRILCPSKNAFDKYEQIMQAIKDNANEDDLVLIALGPTATILAYELSDMPFQSLDIGHLDIEYEWMKMGATQKVPVPNKYVNEAGGGEGVSESLDDKVYQSQIICTIKGLAQ